MLAKLLEEALKITAGDHTIAAEALDLLLESPEPRPASWPFSTREVRSAAIAAIHGHRCLRPTGQG